MSAMMVMLPKIIFESAPSWRQTRHCTSKIHVHPRSEEYVQTVANTTPPTKLPISDLLAYPATCQPTKRPATPPQKKTKCTYKAGGNEVVGRCACHIETPTPYTTNLKIPKCLCFPEVQVQMHMVFSKGIYQSRPRCIGPFTSRLALTQRTSGDQSRSNAQTGPQTHRVRPNSLWLITRGNK